MDIKQDLSLLKQTADKSVSPYHCILEAERQLIEAGFSKLELTGDWSLIRGHSYYVPVFDSTLFAFTVGKDMDRHSTIRMAAAHTDWPCFKLKPSPEVTSGTYGKLNVEVYGGPIFSSWLDRPLSIAGKVCTKGDTPFNPNTIFVDFGRPLLTIPNLAIHMNRETNQGVALNPQKDLLPLIARLDESLNRDGFFLKLLSQEIQTDPADILDYELFLYCKEEGMSFGINQEFFSSPRLDNITSVQAALCGITAGNRENGLNVIAIYDNEEIGSHTKQGAASPLAERILGKIYKSLGLEDYLTDALFSGFLLSMDVAHALHPNHEEKNDITNKIYLGDGVAIKMAARQSYATDARAVSVVESLCLAGHIPYKKYSNRSDIPGGSTLGAISCGCLNMPTADIGVPILAMHSARETMGASDMAALAELCRVFFH